jgi:hypothetical protein
MKFGLTVILASIFFVPVLMHAKIGLKINNPNLQINLPAEISLCGPFKDNPKARFGTSRACLENTIKFGGTGSTSQDEFNFAGKAEELKTRVRKKTIFNELRAISWEEIDRSQKGSEGFFTCKALVIPLLNSPDGEITFDTGCQVQVRGKKTVSIYFDENDKQWKYANFCDGSGSCIDLKKPGMVEKYKNELPSIDSIIGG